MKTFIYALTAIAQVYILSYISFMGDLDWFWNGTLIIMAFTIVANGGLLMVSAINKE